MGYEVAYALGVYLVACARGWVGLDKTWLMLNTADELIVKSCRCCECFDASDDHNEGEALIVPEGAAGDVAVGASRDRDKETRGRPALLDQVMN